MGLRINTNVEAFNAHRNLSQVSGRLSKSMERLSSGFRINRAGDDAAGLGISERMRAQMNGVAQASRNAQDGISLVQTAEGSMQEFHSILHRIRDLAIQFNNTVYDAQSRLAITSEVAQLSLEINRMIGASTFNGIALLSGVQGTPMATLQIGANNNEIVTIEAVAAFQRLIGAPGVGPTTPGFDEIAIFAGAVVGNTNPATIDIANLDLIIDEISRLRSNLGSIQNRLEHSINFLSVYQENLSASESRIRDVDMAAEMTQFTKLQILQQSGTAMLAQANMGPQALLSLLR